MATALSPYMIHRRHVRIVRNQNSGYISGYHLVVSVDKDSVKVNQQQHFVLKFGHRVHVNVFNI